MSSLGTGPSKWAPTSLSTERALQLAADPCRRALLRVLYSNGSARSLEDVVQAIDAPEYSTQMSCFDDPSEHGLAFLLRHVHLPQLDAADIVSYDPEHETIALDQNAADLQPLISFIHE